MTLGRLSYCERRPPLALLILAKFKNVSFDLNAVQKDQEPMLMLASGDVLSGKEVLKHVASIGEGSHCIPSDTALMNEMDQWMDYSQFFKKEYDLKDICRRLDIHLSLRTFLMGSVMTLSDFVIWEGLTRMRVDLVDYCHINRWRCFLESKTEIQNVIQEWLPAASNNTPTDSKKPAAIQLELPNAKMGHVVTRFPPEPSGYLHIGHAKAALLNYHIAKQYKGRIIIRFDDTNPSKEKDEFVENILKDLSDLGIIGDRVTYTSDYFDKLIHLATCLIEAGKVYADNTPVDIMRQERMDGVKSKCRDRSVKENLDVWKKMQLGDEDAVAFCLRIKLDMSAANKALRDPVIYRCNASSHWRMGMKYKVYPTYDFACPFVDSFEGVTHALRSSEYKDREAQYQWILKEMQNVDASLPNVEVMEFARLNLIYTVLSKRKLQKFVDTGRVEGWNDPRFPTVQGMLRRGLTLEALKEYILSQGASKNITFQEWDKIWTINKKVIDPVVPRHTAIEINNKRRLTVNAPAPEWVTVLRHKKYPEAGKKLVMRQAQIWIEGVDAALITPGEEITLMDWGNCIIDTIDTTDLKGRLHLEGDFKKTKWKWTWLPDIEELIPLSLVYFDYLITKPRLDEDDNFDDFVNPNTKTVIEAFGDCNMRVLSVGAIIQLERKGYFIVDRPFWKSQPMVLLNIPDGRKLKK